MADTDAIKKLHYYYLFKFHPRNHLFQTVLLVCYLSTHKIISFNHYLPHPGPKKQFHSIKFKTALLHFLNKL